MIDTIVCNITTGINPSELASADAPNVSDNTDAYSVVFGNTDTSFILEMPYNAPTLFGQNMKVTYNNPYNRKHKVCKVFLYNLKYIRLGRRGLLDEAGNVLTKYVSLLGYDFKDDHMVWLNLLDAFQERMHGEPNLATKQFAKLGERAYYGMISRVLMERGIGCYERKDSLIRLRHSKSMALLYRTIGDIYHTLSFREISFDDAMIMLNEQVHCAKELKQRKDEQIKKLHISLSNKIKRAWLKYKGKS